MSAPYSPASGHYQVERTMTRSIAYRTLPLASFRLFHRFLDLTNGRNNGRIGMTIEQAMDEVGCSRSTAVAALKELRVRGLVVRTHKADRTAPGKRLKGDHSTWMVTCYPYADAEGVSIPAMRVYERWTPGDTLETLEDHLKVSVVLEKAKGVVQADKARTRPDDATEFTRFLEEESIPF